MSSSNHAPSAADVLSGLATIKDPDLGRDVVSLGAGPNTEAFRGLVRQLAAQVSVRAFRRLPVIQVR